VAADDYSIKVKIVLEDFERKLVDSVKKVQPIVQETFLGVLDTFALKLSALLSNVKNEANKIMEMMRDREHEKEAFLGRMMKRLAGEIDIVAPAMKFVPEEVEAARIVPTTAKEAEVTRIVSFKAGAVGEGVVAGGKAGVAGVAGGAGTGKGAVAEDFERKLVDSIKNFQSIVKEMFLGFFDIFAPELSVLVDGIKNEAVKIMKIMKGREREEETFLRRMTRRLTGEVAVAAPAVKLTPEEVEATRIAPAATEEAGEGVEEKIPKPPIGDIIAGGGGAALGAAETGGEAAGGEAAMAVMAIQALINIIREVLDYLRKVSAVLGAVFKLIETSIMLLIKPIADFIGYILKPIVMLLLRFFILPFYRTIAPKIKEIGDLWDKIFTQIMTPLMPILTDAAETIARVLPYTLPMLIPAIVGAAMLIASPIILLSLIVKQLKDFANWILNGVLWLLKTVEGFAKWLQGGWSWVVNSVLVPFWNAVQGFFSWLVSGWNWLTNNVLIPILNFLKSIAAKGLFGLFGFQWGGEVQKTGLYRLHAGERVVSAGEMAQTVFVYPKIDIGSVNLGSEKDLSRLEERINKAIADALRRRR